MRRDRPRSFGRGVVVYLGLGTIYGVSLPNRKLSTAAFGVSTDRCANPTIDQAPAVGTEHLHSRNDIRLLRRPRPLHPDQLVIDVAGA